jgi:hypothetical protein
MTAQQIILLIVFAFFAWIAIGIMQQRKKRKKLAEFAEYYEEIMLYIRDVAERHSIGDATKANSMIEWLQRKSFCKKTKQQIEELCQLWRSKFAHLYNQ